MPGITIYLPESVFELDEIEAGLLLDELRAIRKRPPGARYAAGALLQRLIGARGDLIDEGLPDAERWALARALDHLRNLGFGGPAIHRLRDAVTGEGPTYKIRLLGDSRLVTFYSYSGAYERNDRLVASPDAVLWVYDVAEGGSSEALILECDRFDRAPWLQEHVE